MHSSVCCHYLRFGISGRYFYDLTNFLCVVMSVETLALFLSLRNALRWGYSNAAVVPCVRASGHGPCEQDRDWTVACFFVKLGRHVKHDEMMNPIDFGGQRSKVKVTMDIYGNKLVNMIETKPFCISLSNLADMLTMVRGLTLLILEVRCQRSRSQWTYMEMSLWTRYQLNRWVLLDQTLQTC